MLSLYDLSCTKCSRSSMSSFNHEFFKWIYNWFYYKYYLGDYWYQFFL